MKEYINELNESFEGLSLSKCLEKLQTMHLKKIVFTSSFGQEDQVLIDQISRNKLPVRIVTLDTGRLFEETYKVMEATILKYNIKIEAFFPNSTDVKILFQEKGPLSFYKSVEDRKECCTIRKIKPLQRALKGADLWITGLRSSQSTARQNLKLFQFDDAFGLIKMNPLVDWSLESVQDYLKENQVPQNELHAKGFVSIGCAPCTRPSIDQKDIRAGRWWWESSKKECGLHLNKNT